MSVFICRFTSKPLTRLFLDWLVENQYEFRREIKPNENIVHVDCHSAARAKAIQDWMETSKAV